MNEKFCILILISLKLVPMGPIDNKSALVQVHVNDWPEQPTGHYLNQCWSISLTHICVTRFSSKCGDNSPKQSDAHASVNKASIGSSKRFHACSLPSHNLNLQSVAFGYWAPRNNFSGICIKLPQKENQFWNAVCKWATIVSRHQWDK